MNQLPSFMQRAGMYTRHGRHKPLSRNSRMWAGDFPNTKLKWRLCITGSDAV